MATSFEPIMFSDLTEKTTAPSDADIIVIEDSTATKKAKWSSLISWIKSKLNIGSTNISGIGDGTITGAINTLNTKIPYKIVVKYFNNVYIEDNHYIFMNAANFGLSKLHLVIAEDITVPGGKIFSGFYNNGTLSYISVTNADGSVASGTVSFNAVAFGE